MNASEIAADLTKDERDAIGMLVNWLQPYGSVASLVEKALVKAQFTGMTTRHSLTPLGRAVADALKARPIP